MKLRIVAVLAAGLLLSGCGTSFTDLVMYPFADDAPPVPDKPATVADATPVQTPNAFCRAVATRDATSNGFDGPTQAKVAQKSYAQCVTLFGAQ
jgi:hypothetical protein